MSARTRSMALDGRSFEASTEQTEDRISSLQAAILGRFAECGPMTHDALVEALDRARVTYPDIPSASPQSVRSRTAALVRRGVIRATNIPGRSAYGRPATVWALASAPTQTGLFE